MHPSLTARCRSNSISPLSRPDAPRFSPQDISATLALHQVGQMHPSLTARCGSDPSPPLAWPYAPLLLLPIYEPPWPSTSSARCVLPSPPSIIATLALHYLAKMRNSLTSRCRSHTSPQPARSDASFPHVQA